LLQVSTSSHMKITIIWDAILHSLLEIYHCFTERYWLNRQGKLFTLLSRKRRQCVPSSAVRPNGITSRKVQSPYFKFIQIYSAQTYKDN